MVLITKDIAGELTSYLASHKYDRTYILTDTNTRNACLPILQPVQALRQAEVITIEAGDTHKDIEQVARIWTILSQSGASRHSLLINLGGDVQTRTAYAQYPYDAYGRRRCGCGRKNGH